MAKNHLQKHEQKKETLRELVRSEAQLDTIGYYEAGYHRRFPTKQTTRTVQLGDNRTISIIPTAHYGYPNTLDFDYHKAIEVLIEENTDWREIFDQKQQQLVQRPRVKQPLRVSTRRLIRLSNRTETGQERKNVRDFLDRHTGTLLKGNLYLKRENRTHQEGFTVTIFNKIFHRGDEMRDGRVAEMNYIWLSDWYLSNFCNGYYKQTNLRLHQSLTKQYAKNLYPHFDRGFTATKGNPWHKRYTDFCQLLGVPIQKTLSRVKQQLGPSLDELKNRAFLKSWKIEKTTDGKDFTIFATPGELWLQDHNMRPKNTDILPLLEKPRRGEQPNFNFRTTERKKAPPEPKEYETIALQMSIKGSLEDARLTTLFIRDLVKFTGNIDDQKDFRYILNDREFVDSIEQGIGIFRRWISEINQHEHDGLTGTNGMKLRTLYNQACAEKGIPPYNRRHENSTPDHVSSIPSIPQT